MKKTHTGITLSLLGFIILVGAFLRFWSIVIDRPIWVDEAFTWRVVDQSSVLQILKGKAHPDHPGLSYLLVSISRAIFGTSSTWPLRLPSLICSIACLPAAYLLGRKIDSPKMGLLLAALMACEYEVVLQGQQARMYSLFLLVLLISLNCAFDVFKQADPSRKELLKLGVCLGVLGWIHQLMISIWISCAISLMFLALQSNSSRTFNTWFQKSWRLNLQVFVVASLINFPNLLLLLRRINKNNPAEMTIAEIGSNLLLSLEHYLGEGLWGGLVLFAACLGWWRISLKISKAYACLLLTTFLSTLFIYYQITEHHIFITERYLLAIVPPIQIGVCMLFVDRSFPKPFRIGGGLMILFLLCRMSLKTYEETVIRSPPIYLDGAAAQFLAEKIQSGDFLSTYPHYNRPLVEFYQQQKIEGSNQPMPKQPDFADFEIDSSPSHQDFWLFLTHSEISDSKHPEELDQTIRTIASAYDQSVSLEQIPVSDFYSHTIIHFSNHHLEAWDVRQNPNRQYQLISVNLLPDKAP